jgi:hypothetical protein
MNHLELTPKFYQITGRVNLNPLNMAIEIKNSIG